MTKKKKAKKSTKKTNKPSFFNIIKKAITEAITTYKVQMADQVNKHKLLSSKSDWSMIEQFVQQCNENPDLRITVKLNDGSTIYFATYKPKQRTIDEQLNSITIEESYS